MRFGARREARSKFTRHQRAMKTDQTSPDKSIQEQRGITITQENFGLSAQDRKIKQRQNTTRSVPGPTTKDGAYGRIGKHGSQLIGPFLICTRKKTFAFERGLSNLHRKSILPQRGTTLIELFRLYRSSRRYDPDEVARLQPWWLVYRHPLPSAKEALFVLGDTVFIVPF